MNVNVLTEGNFGGMLLAKLIAEEQGRSEVEIKVLGGKSSLYSVARTLLGVRGIPVAVVFDADTPEPDAALERQREAEEVIGDVAGRIPFRVLVAVPVLEVLFFQRPELVRRVFGEAVTEHVMELAELSPRRALRKLAPDKPFENVRIDLLRAMDHSDVQALRRDSPLIRDLLSFITTTAARFARAAVPVV
jgi:hypothetical protein